MTSKRLYRAAIASGAFCALTALAACSSSGEKPADTDPDVVARVGSRQLSLAELSRRVPAGLSAEDSTAFVSAYVNNWIDEQLITEVALKEIENTEEIDRLTEEYRRGLIMWEYRRLRCSGDSAMNISASDVAEYYDAHSEEMKLDEPMVRGIYIKIDDHAPRLAQVRKWYKSDKTTDIDNLEKVGLDNAIHYDYFRSTWVPWKQIETKIPAEIPVSSLRKGFTLDFSKDGFTYLLSVSDVLPAGAVMPLEAAEPRIRQLLQALRLNEVDEQLRADLRARAAAAGLL